MSLSMDFLFFCIDTQKTERRNWTNSAVLQELPFWMSSSRLSGFRASWKMSVAPRIFSWMSSYSSSTYSSMLLMFASSSSCGDKKHVSELTHWCVFCTISCELTTDLDSCVRREVSRRDVLLLLVVWEKQKYLVKCPLLSSEGYYKTYLCYRLLSCGSVSRRAAARPRRVWTGESDDIPPPPFEPETKYPCGSSSF